VTIGVKRLKHVQKTKFLTRFVIILFLIFTISPLMACAPLISNPNVVDLATEAPGIALTSLTFISEADAQVSEANPGTNYGNATYLQVDGAADPEVESFIRFTVMGVSGTVQNAKLRVYDSTNASNNGPAIYATGTTWTETALTWKARPARTSGELDNKGSISTNIWVEYDVTSQVNGNGTFSFVLVADSNDAATFSSRQGSQPPQLVIAVAGGQTLTPTVETSATATMTEITTTTETATETATLPDTSTPTSSTSLTFIAEADARVKQSSPSTNYGNATTLQVDDTSDPDLESFVRFTVAGVSGPVQNARVRLYATTNGTKNGPAIYATNPSWNEKDITWNKRPARTSDAVDNKGVINPNSWVEYDVTSLVTGNGTFSFVLAGDSNDAVAFSSRQGAQPPQLVVTTTGGRTLTPAVEVSATAIATINPTTSTDTVTLVGAGDISSCDSNGDELTAQLLENIPGTIFAVGDNAYDNGTSDEFKNCYDPTWGRLKDRIKPVPGNHEYHTAGASGYFQYFNNVPSYYVYNLGNWRIYALNSEIDVSASSDEVKWLQADLAANPTQCVLAYWHQPRWSSGNHHGSNPGYQTLWQTFYEAGAEVVINGHEHNYERFAPMNGTGQADPQGMREFVVGTGGFSHYGFGPILPSSEVHDDTSFGVLKLTLRPGGYDWQFVPVAGSTFTDSGSTECH
jgi:calcineurin-like phosphoesterase family protein